jgi:hypothetical protein
LELSREITQCLLDEAAAQVLVERIDRLYTQGSHRWKLLLPLRSGVDLKLSNL